MSFQQMDVQTCAYMFKVWFYLYEISFYIDRIKILFYRFGRKWTSFGMNIISGILCIVVAVLQRKGMHINVLINYSIYWSAVCDCGIS